MNRSNNFSDISEILKYIKSGSLTINFNNKPTIKISLEEKFKKISVDVLSSFSLNDSNKLKQDYNIKIFDLLATTKEFANNLNKNELTIYINRRGKEVIAIGKHANPKLSRLFTLNTNIEIKDLMELKRLDKDFRN